MGKCYRTPSHFSGFIINVNTIPKNNSWGGFLSEIRGDSVENTGQIHVIRIDPAKYTARRPVESFIDCRSLPIVFLAVPIGDVLFVLSDDLNRVVGTAAVQDEEFQEWILLGNNRQDRLLDESTL